MDFSDFSSKDAIILAIIAIAMYVLVSLVRLLLNRRRIKRNQRTRAPRPVADSPDSSEPPPDEPTPPSSAAQSTYQAHRDPHDAPYAAPAHTTSAYSHSPRETPASFSDHLLIVQLESSVAQLRLEVADLREMLTELQTTRHVSPQYAEAMVMARRGLDAQSIAERCTISIGEAELVAALSRNRQEYENHEENFDEHY